MLIFAANNREYTLGSFFPRRERSGNTGKFTGRFQDWELLEVPAPFTSIVEDRREIIVNHYGRKRERQIPRPQKSFGENNKNKIKPTKINA